MQAKSLQVESKHMRRLHARDEL